MALVAYSDESDISDEDEETLQVPSLEASNATTKLNLNSNSSKTLNSFTNGINSVPPSGIESIIDEDEDFVQTADSTDGSSNQVLLSSLQAVARTPASVIISNLILDVGEDELTDVPTKETWKVSQDVLKKMAEQSVDFKISHPNSTTQSTKNPAITSSTKKTANASNSEKLEDRDDVPLGHTLGKAQQVALASSALGSLLQKKKTLGGKVQLLLPALSELMEEEDEALVVDQSVPVVPRKAAPSKAGTGLFSLLPKPKNLVKGKEANRSLVPHSLFKKPQPPGPQTPFASLASRSQGPTLKHQGGTKNTSGRKAQIKSSKLSSLGLLSGEEDDSDDDNEDEVSGGGVDFFLLDAHEGPRLPPSRTPLVAVSVNDDSMIVNEVAEPAIVSPVNVIDRISNDKQSVLSSRTSTTYFGSSLINANTVEATSPSSPVYDDDRPHEPHFGGGEEEEFIPMTSSSSGVGSSTEIDDEAWRRLTGKKRKAEVIDIIEVNADDALLPREEWMNRAAAQEKPSHSHSKKKGNLPSQQQKRKHQITYLAHQAKEREIELKNDWSAGKVKKQQTRAKYGF